MVPSSVHEMIIVPESASPGRRMLTEMLRESMRHRYRTKIFCQIMFIIMTEKNGDCDYKKSEEQSMQVAKDNL